LHGKFSIPTARRLLKDRKYQPGEKTLMSSIPAPKLQVPDPRGSAVIGKSVTIKGQIFSREDLTIDGDRWVS
jgi:hypothetical protein